MHVVYSNILYSICRITYNIREVSVVGGAGAHAVPGGRFLSPGLCWTQPIPGLRLTDICPRAAPERDPVTFWYEVTVLVKMAFKELEEVDPRLLNHMRLLYSMVGGGAESLAGASFQGRLPGADAGRGTGWEPRGEEGPAGGRGDQM